MPNPETLHRDLTDIFLHEYGDGYSVHPHDEEGLSRTPEVIPASQYLSITLVNEPNKRVIARDVTSAFHDEYNHPVIRYALWGPEEKDNVRFLLNSKLRSVRPAEDLRQMTLYFLQAHQGFFEINIREMVKDENEEVETERDRYTFRDFLIGIPSFVSIASDNYDHFYDYDTRPVIEATGKRPIKLPTKNQRDDLELIFRAAHQRAATCSRFYKSSYENQTI